mgnify:CR=1 FL=1
MLPFISKYVVLNTPFNVCLSSFADSSIILASTNIIDAHENGVVQQTVLIEFESFEKARLAYNSPEYQEALKALDGGADRDIRIFEGK